MSSTRGLKRPTSSAQETLDSQKRVKPSSASDGDGACEKEKGVSSQDARDDEEKGREEGIRKGKGTNTKKIAPMPSTFTTLSLYVSNFPYSSSPTEAHLETLFRKFGDVHSVSLIEKSRSVRFAFVDFAEPISAWRCMNTLNGLRVKSMAGESSWGGLVVKAKNLNDSHSSNSSRTSRGTGGHNLVKVEERIRLVKEALENKRRKDG